jgi:hypothetical protein
MDMELSSEQVHWIGGMVLVVLAVSLLLYETHVFRRPWIRFFLPVVLIGWGVENALDTLVHGSKAPGGYEAETIQHYLQGAVMIAIGGVELLRALGRLAHRLWALVLPAGLVAVGLMFAFHQTHDAAAPAILLVIQHRILGATFIVTGLTKGLAAIDYEERTAFQVAWLFPLLLCGIELMLYTEGGGGLHGGHQSLA